MKPDLRLVGTAAPADPAVTLEQRNAELQAQTFARLARREAATREILAANQPAAPLPWRDRLRAGIAMAWRRLRRFTALALTVILPNAIMFSAPVALFKWLRP